MITEAKVNLSNMLILSILNELEKDNSRLAKEAILKREKDNILLQAVFKAALDPSINYYIKQIPSYTRYNDFNTTLDWALASLETLSKRVKTGNAAVEHLTYILQTLQDADAIVIERIIKRDLRCGVSESTVNKIWKGLIPEYPYMRCSLPKSVKLDSWDWKNGVYSQLKADGMYASVNRNIEGDIEILSRSGTRFPLEQLDDIVYVAKRKFPVNTQTQGELVVYRYVDEGKTTNIQLLPREIGNGILNSVAKGGKFESNEFVGFLVWDQISLNFDENTLDYSERYTKLNEQLSSSTSCIQMIETRIVYNQYDALAHYSEKLAEGLEGTIIKDRSGLWKDGTSKFQVKLKLDQPVDLEVVGFNPGNGKNQDTFGSIICATSDNMLECNVSGFKDEERLNIWNNRDNLIGSIITVMSNNIMYSTNSAKKHSLFLPRFIEFRQDKSTADSFEHVVDQFANAIKGK